MEPISDNQQPHPNRSESAKAPRRSTKPHPSSSFDLSAAPKPTFTPAPPPTIFSHTIGYAPSFMSHATSTQHEPFHAAALRSLGALHAAFAKIVGQLGPNLTALELAQTLGVDRKLGWRMHRLAKSASPFAGAEYLPGEEGIDILLKAAAKKGIAREQIDAARSAVEEYRALEALYAGDRSTLESMLAPLAPRDDESQRLHLQHRREMFLAQSRVWGIRGRVQLRADFVHPSTIKPGWEDFVAIRGFLDLARLREDLRWIMPRAKLTDERKSVRVGCWYPLDPDAAASLGAPLLTKYSSSPTPRFKEVRSSSPTGNDPFTLTDWPVGVRSPLSVVLGEAGDAMCPSWTNDPSFKGESYTRVYTPVETLVMDHFVHKDLFGRLNPTLHVLCDLGPWMPYPMQSEMRMEMPVPERVEYLGRGTAYATLPEMPTYRELLDDICAIRNWNASDFDVYRVRLIAPPTPCTVTMRYPMPYKPGPIEHDDTPHAAEPTMQGESTEAREQR